MKYKSTRGGESNVSFEKVLLSAYASDGGLYVPESLPCFTAQQLRSWAPLTFPLVCAEILQMFTDLPITQCRAMTRDAFASFNGADFYGLPRNTDTITLKREPWTVPEQLPLAGGTIAPLRAGETLRWRLV